MSDQHGTSVPPVSPHAPPPRPPQRPRRHPSLTFLMVAIGVILLLPGLCALVFAGALGPGDPTLMLLWLICILFSAGGVALIVKAFR